MKSIVPNGEDDPQAISTVPLVDFDLSEHSAEWDPEDPHARRLEEDEDPLASADVAEQLMHDMQQDKLDLTMQVSDT